MEEVIENESEKTLDQKKVELERKQFEKNIKLANQARAFCYAHNPGFFEVGKEECELLEKYFPEDAKKLKEKFSREQKKDERHPGSVNYSDLLTELEGLAAKAFKTMLENMKSSKPKTTTEKKEEKPLSEFEMDQMQKEYDQEKKEYDNAKRESQEAEKNRPAQTKNDSFGAKSQIIQDLEDSYYEGYTGKKVVREKTTSSSPNSSLSKKEQKKMLKQQKKMEKAQKKLEKAQKKNKEVSSISLDEINKAKNEMGQGKSTQSAEDAKKLKAYENSLKERQEAKAAEKQDNSASQEQGMGMAREYNPPTPSSKKPKR